MADRMTDPRVLQAGHAPTPFTADEIRAAAPSGYSVETVTEINGDVIGRQRTVFTDATPEGVLMVSAALDESGAMTDDRRQLQVTWSDLQAHASFPADVTTVSDETIVSPLGTVACLRYDVAGPDHTNVFWFSPAHPGMPIKFASDAINGPTTTVVAIQRPG